MIIKQEIFDELLKKLQETYNTTIRERDSTAAAAVDAPGRNESRYDTSKVELGYLADSLSKKAGEMEQALTELKAFKLPPADKVVRLGSLVEINNQGKQQFLFLLPSGGQKISCSVGDIIVMSKTAPLFADIINKQIGDTVFFRQQSITIKKIY